MPIVFFAMVLLTAPPAAAADRQSAGATPAADAPGAVPSRVLPGDAGGAGEAADGDPAPEAIRVSLRRAAHERMKTLLEQKRYAEAVEAARQVVDLTRRQFGEESLKMAAPMDNLATSLMLTGDLIDAEQLYKASIALIERTDGFLSARLVNPYIGLGATYNRGRRYEQAVMAFETALRLNHVNHGFYNFDQFKIRDGLTESFIGLDEFGDANFHQEIQLELSQRKLGEDNPEVTDAMYKLARWYRRSGQVELGRDLYRRAQRLLRREGGREDPRQVEALEGIAATYEAQGLMSQGASALKDALEVVEAQPEPDLRQRADLLVRLGDLYTSFGKTDTALVYYGEAWRSLEGPELVTRRDELFDRPVRVSGLSFTGLRYASREAEQTPREALADGYVLVAYDVTAAGRSESVRVVEADPPGMLEDRVAGIIERSYYRPRFDEGEPVTSSDVFYRHDFRYRPADREARRDDGRDARGGGRLEYPGSDGP